jgi:hypothetical protein
MDRKGKRPAAGKGGGIILRFYGQFLYWMMIEFVSWKLGKMGKLLMI